MTHKLSPAAKLDLDDIWLYIAMESNSVEFAEQTIANITARFYLLAHHPYIGRRRDEDLRPGMRSFPIDRHVIIYRVKNGEVLILRVIDGRREYLNMPLSS